MKKRERIIAVPYPNKFYKSRCSIGWLNLLLDKIFSSQMVCYDDSDIKKEVTQLEKDMKDISGHMRINRK